MDESGWTEKVKLGQQVVDHLLMKRVELNRSICGDFSMLVGVGMEVRVSGNLSKLLFQ
jgi:hypothetical protein